MTKPVNPQYQEALLELKDRALAASAEGITIADATQPGNPLIYVNAGFERLTGYTAEEVLGRNCNFLQGPETSSSALEALRAAIQDKREITLQLLNYRKDGSLFWNRLSITPVRDASGAVTHFIGVQSDVTAEIQAKEELHRTNQQLEAASRAVKADLEAAAEIQKSLLPSALPALAGFRFAYKFRPCLGVGGDCLDIFPLDSRHTALYILDVSGHGVAAALLSVSLSHMLSAAPDRSFLYQPDPGRPGAYSIASPADVVSRLNTHFIARGGTGQYFTMIYGVLDKESGEFVYAAAGQFGPVYCPKGSPHRILETGGMPIGLLPVATYQEHRQQLSPGDRLCLCTDGIIDAMNDRRQEFGVRRLIDSLQAHSSLPLEDLLSAVVLAAEAWSAPSGPADDVSLLAVERC
jgi:PAS domain S-box-containing protein